MKLVQSLPTRPYYDVVGAVIVIVHVDQLGCSESGLALSGGLARADRNGFGARICCLGPTALTAAGAAAAAAAAAATLGNIS